MAAKRPRPSKKRAPQTAVRQRSRKGVLRTPPGDVSAASKRSVEGPPVQILPDITGSRLGQRRGKCEDVVWFDPIELALGGVAKIALDSGIKIESVG
jgi:hypothetical protein